MILLDTTNSNKTSIITPFYDNWKTLDYSGGNVSIIIENSKMHNLKMHNSKLHDNSKTRDNWKIHDD